ALGGGARAEPGAAGRAGRRGVRLGERLEQQVDVDLGHADAGVGDGDPEPGAALLPRRARGADVYLAVLGELHGVRAQVREHLGEAGRVTGERLGDVGVAR